MKKRLNLSSLFQSKKVQLLIIILLTIIAYSNIFQNELLGADVHFFVNWPLIKQLHNIPAAFYVSVPPKSLSAGEYRPVRTVFLIMFYHLWGINILGYHLVSLLIHIINIILVYLIIDKITKKRTIAFISSLLFALHPIQTESITFMSVSINTIGINFYLASFYLYLRARDKFRDKLPKYSLSYLFSVILAGLAFFHYEMTITLPLIILFYDLVFKYLNLKKINIYSSLKIYAPYFILALSYIFVRVVLLHIVGREEYLGGSFYLTMLTMTKAFVRYMELMLLPINLSIYPNVAPGISSSIGTYAKMDKILSQSILDLDILRNIGIILSLITITIIFLKKSPLISFSVGFFLISLLPVSNIIPLGVIMQERYAYLASFGYVLLLAYLISLLYKRKYQPNLAKTVRVSLIIFLVIIMSGYFYLTYQRNKDWRDGISLWSSFLRQTPDHVHGHYILAQNYEFNNYDDLAIKEYQKTLSLYPDFLDVYFRIGNIYNRQGNKEQAFVNYLKDKSSKIYKLENKFTDSDKALIFLYPKDWQTKTFDQGVRLTDPKNSLNMEIVLDVTNLSSEDYLKKQREEFGILVNEGLAQIPNVDSAYVKVWNDAGVKKLQFFLLKDTKVVKILVYPGDSQQRDTFEDILRSIIILD